FIQTEATLPIHHNALSRAFVNTFGRLGRWKRVLNSRSATRPPLGACTDVSAFDLELTVSRDMLMVNGGVAQYLKMIEQQQQQQQQQQQPQPPSALNPSGQRQSLKQMSPKSPDRPAVKLNGSAALGLTEERRTSFVGGAAAAAAGGIKIIPTTLSDSASNK